MKNLKRWHLLLVPIPIFGWLLLAALIADEFEFKLGRDSDESNLAPTNRDRRATTLTSIVIDLTIAATLWTLLPPAIGWLLGAILLLCRDVGRGTLSPGHWIAGEVEPIQRSFTSSFGRNLPLLLPILGPIIELALIWTKRPRLGERLSSEARRELRAPR